VINIHAFPIDANESTEKIQKLVRENGGIGALVKLLQSTSPQVLLHTCEALIQLVKDNGTWCLRVGKY
jgi:hypothetical protein